MVYRKWQSLWNEHDERNEIWLARWSGLSKESLNEWDLEPDYGAFVDQNGRIVSGARQREAWLDSPDPQKLEWSSSISTLLREHSDARAVFLDWGTQSQPWDVIFSAWESWEAQDLILSCGPVDVAFALEQQWRAPAFVVFRSAFAHGLDVTEVNPKLKAESLLERAQALRNAGRANPAPAPLMAETATVETGEPLPMLPFTLASLNDEEHAWPVGTSTFGA